MSTQDSNSSVTVPTMDDVRKAIRDAIEEHAASRNHPDATLKDKGLVSLSNDVNSNSETAASTPKAIKTAYDLASAANQNADNANENANNANGNANTRLEKGLNGADIPDKDEFVKNLGLAEGSILPIGVPVPWPTENPPEGWLICNGNSFDKAKYPRLAFAYPSGVLPDLRGEFIRGWDSEGTIDPKRTLLSKQQATLLPSVYSYAYSDTTGTLVTPPVKSYKPSLKDFMASDYEDPVISSGPYLRTDLQSGGGVSLASFRVRPRNIAFNYIVRAA